MKRPTEKISDDHIAFDLNSLGIKANNKVVIIIKVVMEWPEGKLEWVEARVLPIMVKLSLSKTAAGLGTRKIFFKDTEKSNPMRDEVKIVLQNLGA